MDSSLTTAYFQLVVESDVHISLSISIILSIYLSICIFIYDGFFWFLIFLNLS